MILVIKLLSAPSPARV